MRLSDDVSSYTALPTEPPDGDHPRQIVADACPDRASKSDRRVNTVTMHASEMALAQLAAEEAETQLVPALRFVEQSVFQGICGAIIILNLAVLGLETDIQWHGWHFVNTGFICFYSLELALRMSFRGINFFLVDDRHWNVFDLSIVALGVTEVWLLPLAAPTRKTHSSLALRAFRLLRLLRLLRVLHIFDDLQRFVSALFDMMFTICWIFMIIFLFCYVTAIVLTHMIGHGEGLDLEHAQNPEELQELRLLFCDVSSTLFTLFRLMTMDTWHDLAYPLVELNGLWRLFFVIFISFTSWTMISLLTAAVSEHMIDATANFKLVQAKREAEAREAFTEHLTRQFRLADTNGNAELDKDEFVEWAGDPQTRHLLEKVGIVIEPDELVGVFDILDGDHSGTLTIEEFTKGFVRAHEKPVVKDLFVLDNKIMDLSKVANNNAEAASKQNETLEQLLPSMASHVTKLLEEHAAAELTVIVETFSKSVESKLNLIVDKVSKSVDEHVASQMRKLNGHLDAMEGQVQELSNRVVESAEGIDKFCANPRLHAMPGIVEQVSVNVEALLGHIMMQGSCRAPVGLGDPEAQHAATDKINELHAIRNNANETLSTSQQQTAASETGPVPMTVLPNVEEKHCDLVDGVPVEANAKTHSDLAPVVEKESLATKRVETLHEGGFHELLVNSTTVRTPKVDSTS